MINLTLSNRERRDMMQAKLVKCILNEDEPLINIVSASHAQTFLDMLAENGVLVSMLNKTLDGSVMFEFVDTTIGAGRYASIEFFNDGDIVYLTHMPDEGICAWDLTEDALTERLAGIAEYLGKLVKKHNQHV